MTEPGYLWIEKETIFVFFEKTAQGTTMKIRFSNEAVMGTCLKDESVYLSGKPKLLTKLRKRETITI